jgi:NADH-quinone oxidoreductase subunit M
MQPGVFAHQKLAFLLLYIGFGILAGVWPFTPGRRWATWPRPRGEHAACRRADEDRRLRRSARGHLPVPRGLAVLGRAHGAAGPVGIVYGALVALRQTDLKYVVGYSSVSHMGIVGLGLATVSVDGLNGAVFQMFAHGVMTALLLFGRGLYL